MGVGVGAGVWVGVSRSVARVLRSGVEGSLPVEPRLTVVVHTVCWDDACGLVGDRGSAELVSWHCIPTWAPQTLVEVVCVY